MARLLPILVVALGLALAVTACGRKADPEPPPESDYPRQYPAE